MNQAFAVEVDEGEAGGGFLAHLPAILWQRRLVVLPPLLLGVLGAIVAVLLIPPVYRSTALMLVQSPQLPDEVVGNGGELIDRRIAGIKEQVTSRPDLVALIDKHGLYAEERRRGALSKVISEMRAAISLVPTTVDAAGIRPEKQTIAFELAFDYKEPAAAQAVAQDLMERIVELDASGSAEQASNTVQFLTDQAKGLETRIAELQSQMAVINARNGGVLTGAGTMSTAGSGSFDVQIAMLQRDNSNLIAQRDLAKSADTRDPAVVAAEAALATARSVYSESHPDVVVAKQRLEEARRFAKGESRKLPTELLEQQVAFNNSQIAALRAARAQEIAQISSSLRAQARAPLVQQQLKDLDQQLTAANEQYRQVSQRLMAAKAGVRAEDEQMGERLAIVEPPVLPDTPVSPNRPLLAALGVGGGLVLGLFLALAVELILRPIRDPAALARLTGHSTLGVIPVILRRTRTVHRWWERLLPLPWRPGRQR